MFACCANSVCASFHSVSSGSDSDSDDSEKNSTENELSKLNKPSGNDEGADSGNSTVAEDEDDFNPFGMSGSEDEGEHLQFVFQIFCTQNV